MFPIFLPYYEKLSSTALKGSLSGKFSGYQGLDTRVGGEIWIFFLRISVRMGFMVKLFLVERAFVISLFLPRECALCGAKHIERGWRLRTDSERSSSPRS